VSHSSFACDLFCALSLGLVFISNANPSRSCVYICKFQFRPIHPPLGDFQYPPTQDEDRAQEEEGDDQDDGPPQEEDIDQGGDEDDQDNEDDQEIQDQRPPHPRVHQAIQRDHPVNSILGDIHKVVTTQSRVAHFCEHYSFVSSIEPYRMDDALRDPNWVVAMQ
jgi:hypothetical protein